jgi:hypothetical protein
MPEPRRDDTKGGELLWDPSRLSEEEVEGFLKKCDRGEMIPSPFLSGRHDNSIWSQDRKVITQEVALKKLARYKYNPEKALAKMRRKGLTVSISACPLTCEWSVKEVQQFETGMKKFPKDWRLMANKITGKSLHECVEFYFYWHTSQRYRDWKLMYFAAPKTSLYSSFALGPLISPEEQSGHMSRLRQRPRIEYNQGLMKRPRKSRLDKSKDSIYDGDDKPNDENSGNSDDGDAMDIDEDKSAEAEMDEANEEFFPIPPAQFPLPPLPPPQEMPLENTAALALASLF